MDLGWTLTERKLWGKSWLPPRVQIEESVSPNVRIKVDNAILFPVIEAIYGRVGEVIMEDINEKIQLGLY